MRTIGRRRPHVGSRAIIGGALIAVAVLGTYAATANAGAVAGQPVVVAARDIAPGARLLAGDLKVVEMVVPTPIARNSFSSIEQLTGSTTLGPLRAGDIAQPGAIATTDAPTPYLEISFATPAPRALDGDLRSGETVNVLTTDKSTGVSSARAAALDAHVLRMHGPSSGSIGNSGDVVVTLGVKTSTEAAAIAAAVDQGQITLVRTTGTKP